MALPRRSKPPSPAAMKTRSERWAPAALEVWDRYGGVILLLVCAHATLTAAFRLTYAFHLALVVEGEPIDLLYRIEEVQQWFQGVPIYGVLHHADYPPASYVLLWPFVGWLPVPAVRVVFGLTTVVALAAIAWLSVRASGATRWPAMAFMAVFLLPSGATQGAIWVGQLGLHITALLMGAAVLLVGTGLRPPGSPLAPPSWSVDLLAAVLLAASLMKPTLSVPVVTMLLVVVGRWRPFAFTAAIYVGLTAIALAYQETSSVSLIAAWLGQEGGMSLERGSVNVHLWLHWLGIRGSLLSASLLLLVAGILLAWRYRTVDPWLVLGVAALLSRLWIHHRAYDDVLLAITAVALFRLALKARKSAPPASIGAAALLGALYVGGHVPMWAYMRSASPSLWLAGEAFRTVVWVGVLGFLLRHIRASTKRGGRSHAALS